MSTHLNKHKHIFDVLQFTIILISLIKMKMNKKENYKTVADQIKNKLPKELTFISHKKYKLGVVDKCFAGTDFCKWIILSHVQLLAEWRYL